MQSDNRIGHIISSKLRFISDKPDEPCYSTRPSSDSAQTNKTLVNNNIKDAFSENDCDNPNVNYMQTLKVCMNPFKIADKKLPSTKKYDAEDHQFAGNASKNNREGKNLDSLCPLDKISPNVMVRNFVHMAQKHSIDNYKGRCNNIDSQAKDEALVNQKFCKAKSVSSEIKSENIKLETESKDCPEISKLKSPDLKIDDQEINFSQLRLMFSNTNAINLPLSNKQLSNNRNKKEHNQTSQDINAPFNHLSEELKEDFSYSSLRGRFQQTITKKLPPFEKNISTSPEKTSLPYSGFHSNSDKTLNTKKNEENRPTDKKTAKKNSFLDVIF